ncbi:hypothetical protein [Streptomyces sp. RFCAC02]|uniref:hypothetical protein n=1 Tax=Streptomyces sp. RFCAC02 TaxID=2499143 RepID=UPI0010205BFC|nr:hypothetical protein [Streptomyces sp. RFCAC02]
MSRLPLRARVGLLPLYVAAGALAMSATAASPDAGAGVPARVTADGGAGLREAPASGADVVDDAPGGSGVGVLCEARTAHGTRWYLVRGDTYGWARTRDVAPTTAEHPPRC